MIYDHRCKTCGNEVNNVYNTVAERHINAPVCCGGGMTIVIKSAPYGYLVRDVRYVCPVTHENVTSRRQRKYIMESRDLVNANDFARTYKQRADAKTKNDTEIKAIKDAVPKDLQAHFNGMQKQAADRFLSR